MTMTSHRYVPGGPLPYRRAVPRTQLRHAQVRRLGRWRTVILAGALMLGLATGSMPAQSASDNPPAAPCTVESEVTRALADLGENPANWELRNLAPVGLQGTVDGATGIVSTHADCAMVRSIVNHEYAHLQQIRWHGSLTTAIDYYGSLVVVEYVADCASMLLNSTYTPYLDGEVWDLAVGCSPTNLSHAYDLLAYRHYFSDTGASR